MYKFTDDRQTYRGLKPAQVGKELETIRKRNGGKLHTEKVVDAARPDDAVLHPAFTWDDEVAAEEYRKWEARQLIRVVVVEHPQAGSVHKYVPVSVGTDGEKERYYQAAEVVVQRPDEFQSAYSLLLEKVNGAGRALGELKRLSEGSPDRLSLLAMASDALATARTIVERIQ